MRIAWRYNSLPKVDAVVGHNFDLTKHITAESLREQMITIFDGAACQSAAAAAFHNQIYAQLLENISAKIKQMKAGGEGNLLRISINSLGSPLWYGDKFGHDLCLFLTALKSITRYATAVCCITMPTHLLRIYVSLFEFIFVLENNVSLTGRSNLWPN